MKEHHQFYRMCFFSEISVNRLNAVIADMFGPVLTIPIAKLVSAGWIWMPCSGIVHQIIVEERVVTVLSVSARDGRA